MVKRLLGKCPECKTEDEIIQVPYKEDFSNYSKVRCKTCETTWSDWLELMFIEREKGNQLIPVEVRRHENYSVELLWPRKDEVPHNSLITTILNSALMTKFGLRVCFATEGGLKE